MISLYQRPEDDLSILAVSLAEDIMSMGSPIMNPTIGIAIRTSSDPIENAIALSEISAETILSNTYDGVVIIDITPIGDAYDEESMRQVIRMVKSIEETATVHLVMDFYELRKPKQFLVHLTKEFPKITIDERDIPV